MTPPREKRERRRNRRSGESRRAPRGSNPIAALANDILHRIGEWSEKPPTLPPREKRESRRGRPRDSHAALQAAAPVEGLSKKEMRIFQALRELRLQLARRQNVSVFAIFSNATLREMAQTKPRTIKEMADVQGIGAVKLARYGENFLRAIADSEAENRARGETST